MTDAQKALDEIEATLAYMQALRSHKSLEAEALAKLLALLPLIRAALAPVADGEIEAIRERHDNDGPLFRTEMTPSERQKYTDRATLLAHVDRLSAELEQAKEALKPFACNDLDWLILGQSANNNYEVFIDIGDARCASCGSFDLDDMSYSGFTVADIRAARAALGEKK